MKKRQFPSAGGVFAGVLLLVMSLIADPADPIWVTVKVVMVVFSAAFAAANLIGLLVLRRRQKQFPDQR
jgi:hypothetical protein